MSDTIFAPPQADLETPIARQHDYYVVSPTKFYLLAALTLNVYFVYWFYRNWRLIKERDKDDSWPPMRVLFYIFFTHSLLTDDGRYWHFNDPHCALGPFGWAASNQRRL